MFNGIIFNKGVITKVTKRSKGVPPLKGTMVHGTWSFSIGQTNSFGCNFIRFFAFV